jgi:hypothetical protein
MKLRIGLKTALICAALASTAVPAPAVAEENLWTEAWSVLPGAVPKENSTGFDPTSTDACLAGDARCVEDTAREMERRLMSFARSCDHRALFALAYLHVTRSVVDTPVDFTDRAFIQHQVAVFAEYYFANHDTWSGGGEAAPVWDLAFDAARDKSVSGDTDLMLGFVAHIQRDLPFVLYRIGLTAPDGSSRKRDHDRVNRFLYPVMGPMLEEMQRRFDPSVATQRDIPGTTLDRDALFSVIVSWREQAWRDAERLAAAGSAWQRALVAQDIENRALANAMLYATIGRRSADASRARQAYCSEHWNDF